MRGFKKATRCLLLVTACVLVTGCKKKEDKQTTEGPVRVTVTVAGCEGKAHATSYSGTVSAATATTVSFAVSGTISRLPIEEGARVSKGQFLGSIRSGDYENARNIARAELAEAEDAFNRLKKLHDANALPDIKWVEIQQRLEQARNAAKIAERTLSEATLTSPVSGVISQKLADPGQNVIAGEPVYEIVSDDITVNISVPEDDIANFKEGQTAIVYFDNITDGSIPGRVNNKSVVADALTRTFTVKVAIPSQSGKILPGMTGRVVVEGTGDNISETPVISLPSQAVELSSDNRTFVWVVKEGKAERRFVKANELVAGGVIINEGLAPGDSVITEGMRKVGTGTPVVAVN